ncbi:twin-arginine translocase TatA/TatE family subunit [Anaeromyxobacter oryzae]|uniref:Uncharacterized protein n=1 Tax=Anaeromyxobacter oryzae TaxID=2918170 RepID=A0ABN6MUS6_9BACT|nr:twin-arginine translocase TatA/TatE family subunit [Anaeromyxobacter oryzae]BDG04671.1 hypothetical protein AMOR_36670 [Anaeromyxobacter oryzae]
MTDLAIVVFVAVLVFAATRIPALGDALGRALKRGAPPADGAAPPRGDGPDRR